MEVPILTKYNATRQMALAQIYQTQNIHERAYTPMDYRYNCATVWQVSWQTCCLVGIISQQLAFLLAFAILYVTRDNYYSLQYAKLGSDSY